MRYDSHRSGFTLIEVSIVLIIIGLIVSGVLVGRDLIRAAEIRAGIAQIEQYNTAVNTFRIKFNDIPGDLRSASALGMVTRASHGTGVINGNGQIESTMNNITNHSTSLIGYETTLIWSDLIASNLINMPSSAATDNIVPALMFGDDSQEQVKKYLPSAKLGNGNFVTVFSSQGTNYFQISKIQGISGGLYLMDYGITPQEAFSVDKKMDDGMPLTGVVRGLRHMNWLGTACDPTAAGGSGDDCCGDNAGGSVNMYKTVTPDLAGLSACQMSFRFN